MRKSAAPTHVMGSAQRNNLQDGRQQRVTATRSHTLNYDVPAFTPHLHAIEFLLLLTFLYL